MSTTPAASLERLAQKKEGHEFCSPWAQDTLYLSLLSLNWERELGGGGGINSSAADKLHKLWNDTTPQIKEGASS